MIKIIKSKVEPEILVKFKNDCFDETIQRYVNCSYGNIRNLKELKSVLLKEQYYLCAYCNKEIDDTTSSIEHWYPQNACKILATYNTSKGLDIDYYNLIAVCLGNHGNPYFLHCDKERAKFDKYDQMLTLKPHSENYDFEKTFMYEAGKLVSKNGNTIIQDEVDRKLNLNHQTLINYRNKALDQFIKSLGARKDKGFLELQLRRYSTPNSDMKLKKYCTMITHSIIKKLEAM